MLNLSIFAKPAFLNINPGQPLKERTKPIPSTAGHVQRVSSIIRGDQIAERIGAKLNPESGYEDDVCVFVKPMVRKGDDFKFEGRVRYLDIIDGHNLGQLARKYPTVRVIVCSWADYDIMTKELPNPVEYIPQHHCNFDRIKRPIRPIKVLGVIGTLPAFDFLPKALEAELAKRHIKLLTYSRFFERQDIIGFYRSIDVQLVWRPYSKILSNPLKIVNASAFGVPTIALDEKAFKELEDTYLPVDAFEGFLTVLDALVGSPAMYEDYSNRCLAMSERYHIDRVGEMYKRLCTT